MSKRLVVCSDQRHIASTVESSLPEGFDVSFTRLADATAERVGQLLPDLIVLDTPVTGYDVASLVSKLRKDEVTGKIPLLLLYGAFQTEAAEAASQLDVQATLARPFTAEQLRATVQTLLEKVPEPATAEQAAKPAMPEAVELSQEQIDAALEKALEELELGQTETAEAAEAQLSISPEELEMETASVGRPVDEGVSRVEAEELFSETTFEPSAKDRQTPKPQEATTVSEQPQSGQAEGEGLLDQRIDALVEAAMQKATAELKAELKKAFRERMTDMAKRIAQELLPKLSEKIVNEVFGSKSEE